MELLTQLVNAEKQYLTNLKHIVSVWLKPFREGAVDKLDSANSTSYASMSSQIFGNIENILAFTETIVPEMETRLGKWSAQSTIGDLFLSSVCAKFFWFDVELTFGWWI